MSLTEEQIERYSRQIILPNVGGKGQERLLKAKVLVVGCGGLGSAVGYYLAAAGIGRIGLVDSDKVELNNLQRQILHFTRDIGKPKVESAREKLLSLNPELQIITHGLRLTSENVLGIFKDYDIVIDGSDNFPTRYLVNDACFFLDKPLSTGAILRFDGQATTILPGKGPCYRCIYPEPPEPGLIPSCQEAGILGAVAGIIGLIQVNEVLKLILNIGDLLVGRLLVLNALRLDISLLAIRRSKTCPLCSNRPKIKKLIDYQEFCRLKPS